MPADDRQLTEQKPGLLSAILGHIDVGAVIAWAKRHLIRRPPGVLELVKALDDSKADIEIETPDYSASKKSRANKPARISIEYKKPP